MPSKVLILGARGMLGQALQRTALQAVEAIAWDRSECDIANHQEVIAKIPSTATQWIINCAAYNGVDDAQAHQALVSAINAEAVGFLAEVAKGMNARLIHMSSDYVFAGTVKEGYAESDEPNPISIYGQSKLRGEQMALQSPGAIVIRTSRLFGKPGVGKKSFVDVVLEKAKDQDRIEVIDEETSSPTLVDDLAKEIWKLVANPLSAAGIYHRTNDGACTWFEFAQEIIAVKKIECELVSVDSSYYQRAAQRPKHSILLTTKLPPLRPWQEALKEYLENS